MRKLSFKQLYNILIKKRPSFSGGISRLRRMSPREVDRIVEKEVLKRFPDYRSKFVKSPESQVLSRFYEGMYVNVPRKGKKSVGRFFSQGKRSEVRVGDKKFKKLMWKSVQDKKGITWTFHNHPSGKLIPTLDDLINNDIQRVRVADIISPQKRTFVRIINPSRKWVGGNKVVSTKLQNNMLYENNLTGRKLRKQIKDQHGIKIIVDSLSRHPIFKSVAARKRLEIDEYLIERAERLRNLKDYVYKRKHRKY